jgi:hypothetical protein
VFLWPHVRSRVTLESHQYANQWKIFYMFNFNNSSYGVTSEVTTDSLPTEPSRIGTGRGLICHKGSVPNTLLHLQDCFYRCNTILWWTRLYHTCIQMKYRTCTCCNCLPEGEPSGSKHVHVEYVVKIILNITEMRIVGLQNVVISQCTVQINTATEHLDWFTQYMRPFHIASYYKNSNSTATNLRFY